MELRTGEIRIMLAVAFISLGSIAASQEPFGSETSSVRHHARALQPGEVVELVMDFDEPLRQARAEFCGEAFVLNGAPDGRHWSGLLGIDLDVKPGAHSVSISGTTGEHKAFAFEYPLHVKDKLFPTRRLRVNPRYVQPPRAAMGRIEKEAALLNEIFRTTTAARLWDGTFLAPVKVQANSSFGTRSIYNGEPRSPHSGADYPAAAGSPIRVPNAGKVVLASDLYYSGKTVVLDHGQGLYSVLAHMSKMAVNKGDFVQRGAIVGNVGASGRVTGPHLHWSVRLSGTRIDPLSLIELTAKSSR
jgi:murein DD-endopeptidase MepM/ murein hydrolase activator NlpD